MGIIFCFRQPVLASEPSPLYLLYTMPAARKKTKTKKSQAHKPIAEPEPENEVEQTIVDDNAMQTDQPEPSSSTSPMETAANIVASAEAAVVNVAEAVVETMEDVIEAASELIEETTTRKMENGGSTSQSGNATPVESEKEAASKLTLEERKVKLVELRRKLVTFCFSLVSMDPTKRFEQAESSKANRSSLVEEAAKAKITARDAARLERQRKLAEMLRTKADAEERGEDVERQKNWEYTIEENEEWEKKLARKKRRADFEFHGRLLSCCQLGYD